MTPMSTRIGIVGYGNLGRGVEHAIDQNPDMELVAVFTRRDPGQLSLVHSGVPVYSVDSVADHRGSIDVMVLCGGSKGDLPEQGPELAALFNTVDSFDTHAEIPNYFAALNAASGANGHLALISTGWDPGLFSLSRVIGESVIPSGSTHSFWGKGVSQGHSAALRKVEGVAGAIQYTVPSQEAIDAARAGQALGQSAADMHLRECYVVLEEGADAARVEHDIVTMPHYFDEYKTVVNFISAEELAANHAGLPHGGFVVRSGTSAAGDDLMLEFSLKLDSNPAFTACVMVACARAVHRLSERGEAGARTIFDIPPALLSPKSAEELRAQLL